METGNSDMRARELRRVKLAATSLLIAMAALFAVSRHF
jgi:uncharacterized membrane-anchored protein YjiN (DUF445 family)